MKRSMIALVALVTPLCLGGCEGASDTGTIAPAQREGEADRVQKAELFELARAAREALLEPGPITSLTGIEQRLSDAMASLGSDRIADLVLETEQRTYSARGGSWSIQFNSNNVLARSGDFAIIEGAYGDPFRDQPLPQVHIVWSELAVAGAVHELLVVVAP